MKAAEYIKALEKGSEVVIVSNNPNENSAVFYMNTYTGKLYTFSRFFGVVERTDMTTEELSKHLENIAAESRIFIRGYED